jgi:hypothetical protein
MSAVSETIVRDYFELHGFLVRQPRKHTARSARDADVADLVVLNPRPAPLSEPLPFLLEPEHLTGLVRGLVVVKGWHTEVFSSTRLNHKQAIFRFVAPARVREVSRELGEGPVPTRVLVLPALPAEDEARQRSIEVLRRYGIDAAIPFRTILVDLLRRVQPNRDYRKSDVLQLLRILKNYDLLRDPQLELFGSPRRRGSQQSPTT